MKKLFLLFLTLPLIYLSCHKEEETEPTTKTESKIIDSIWHLEYCVSEVYKRIDSTTVVNNPFQRQYSSPISYCTDHYSESAHLEFPSDSTFTYIHMPLIREYDITEQKVDNFGNTTFIIKSFTEETDTLYFLDNNFFSLRYSNTIYYNTDRVEVINNYDTTVNYFEYIYE